MVQFTLPSNSKITEGIKHKIKEPNESPKKLVIYRWDPEDDKNPRLDTYEICLLYTSPSPRDRTRSRMPSSA